MSAATSSPSLSRSDKLIEGFKSDCRIRGMAEGSAPKYLSVINIFNKFLEGQGADLLDVDRDVLRDFLEYLRIEREASHKTVANYFTVLSSLYEYLAYEGYVKQNPVVPVRRRYLKRYKQTDEGQMRQTVRIRLRLLLAMLKMAEWI